MIVAPPRPRTPDSYGQPPLVDDLQPGTYKLRLVKGGPFVAAELCYGPPCDPITGEELDRSWRWSVLLNGESYTPDDPRLSDDMVWRVAASRMTTRADHNHMVRVARWCGGSAPGLPEANPRRSVDLGRMSSLF